MRLCKRGHDLDVVGQTASGYCKECNREYQREYIKRSRRAAGMPEAKRHRLNDPVARAIRSNEATIRWARRNGAKKRKFKDHPRAVELGQRTSTLMHQLFGEQKPLQIPIAEDLIWLVLNDDLWEPGGVKAAL